MKSDNEKQRQFEGEPEGDEAIEQNTIWKQKTRLNAENLFWTFTPLQQHYTLFVDTYRMTDNIWISLFVLSLN